MSDSDEIIEQLFVDVSEFIIDELEDDTHEKMLKPVEKKFQRKKRYIQRGREEGHNRLVADYFSDQPVFPPYIFRRSTSIEFLKNFCRGVIEVFGPTYLRRPNDEDVARILHLHEEHHGFPGMLGSIECMHWAWKNCPVAWHGQFTRGDHGVPTIMLEAVASQDLWIWHAFFGVAGSNNDINVLNQSTLFNDVLQGYSPDVKFIVNGTEYTKGYYLADGIYPEWATIVKSFSCPQDLKRKKFKEMQEAARKDVERAFGVLQSRWAIIRRAARFWMDTTMSDIIYACIIMHNMIVENEGNAISHWSDEDGDPPIRFRNGFVGAFNEYIQRSAEISDKIVHNQLRSDLVEHMWEKN
ncbi:hypothetical protein L6452_35965 [Arctium lappa]|uniref:Uncharacterized protein n=1 Tax=Arctium lappa TaxID=4217 RepID=A0ACB8Y7V9_ARCLA|nr:hypothetical protein L6452_35965 [Arctium lappa]